MADMTNNQASSPLRRATSFYDFSSLDGNGGQTAPGASQQASVKPAAGGTAGGGGATPANGGAPTGGTTTATGTTGTTGTNVANGTNGGATGGTTATTRAQDNPYAQLAVKSYGDMERIIRERMNELPPEETKEDREKRERREKHRGFLARLADGIGSFHTTFAYARGEKPMDMPQMSKRATELYEKAKAAREKNRDQRMNYALKIGDLGNEKAKVLREIEAQQEAQRLAREKGQREQEAHDWEKNRQPYVLKEAQGKATTAEEKAKTAKAEAENAPEYYKAKVGTEKARGVAQKASAASSYASANKNRVEAGQGFPWKDEKGKIHLAKTEREANVRHRQSGWPFIDNGEYTETLTQATDMWGNPLFNDGDPVMKIASKEKRREVPNLKAPKGKKDTGAKWGK